MLEIGKKYSWKHAPERYSLVVGFFKDQIVIIKDIFIDEENAIEYFELSSISGFKCLTNFEQYKNDK